MGSSRMSWPAIQSRTELALNSRFGVIGYGSWSTFFHQQIHDRNLQDIAQCQQVVGIDAAFAEPRCVATRTPVCVPADAASWRDSSA